MARNWDLRRSLANYTEKVDDASERLRQQLTVNIDQRAIVSLMNEIQNRNYSSSRIRAAIDRAEQTRITSETLVETLKCRLKWKECEEKVCIYILFTCLLQQRKTFLYNINFKTILSSW